jgi:hypothetical protein
MTVGALTATDSPLYAATYPTATPTVPTGTPSVTGPPSPSAKPPPDLPEEGSNFLWGEMFEEQFGDALTKAKVLTETSPSKVVQHERTTLTATVVLGLEAGESEEAPEVEVAWENEATLSSAQEGAIEVAPTDAVTRTLAECVPRDEGGCGVSWSWTIVPRVTGPQRLLLTVSPRVFIDGQRSDAFARRNADIPVDVLVHPAEGALKGARAAVEKLVLDMPKRVTSGGTYTVTARLPSGTPVPDIVTTDLLLEKGEGSPDVVITALPLPTDDSGGLVRSWEVTPSGSGKLTLVVRTTLTAQAGDQPLTDKAVKNASLAVDDTFGDQVNGWVTWVGGLVGLALAVLGVWTAVGRLRGGSERRRDGTEPS